MPKFEQTNIVNFSAIIVTWNGLRYLPQCFDALLPQLPPDAEIILVDNGSTDGTAAWAHSVDRRVRLLPLRTNLGFAGGVNAGLRAASGDLLLLLNNDAFVEPGFIAALCDALKQRPTMGAAGGVLTFAHQPTVVASAGIRLRRDGLALDLWTGLEVNALPDAPQPIFGPSGGAVLYRRALLEDVGLLEPSFFAYLEDADLALRARLRGWQSIVVPAARARHVYSATGGHGSPFKQRLLARNRVRTLIRCLPNPLLVRCLPLILMYDVLAIGYSVLYRQPAIVSGRFAALQELTQLLAQRRIIQQRRTTPVATIESWLEPVPHFWHTLAAQQHVDTLVNNREHGLAG